VKGEISKGAIVKMTSEASPRTYAPAHSGVGLMMYQVGYAQEHVSILPHNLWCETHLPLMLQKHRMAPTK
jgi:hypothetical protein